MYLFMHNVSPLMDSVNQLHAYLEKHVLIKIRASGVVHQALTVFHSFLTEQHTGHSKYNRPFQKLLYMLLLIKVPWK